MTPSPHVIVRIDLARVRDNVAAIRRETGVEVWPVIKADAYGLGASHVALAVREVADGFCVFALREAAEIELDSIGRRPIIAIGPPDSRNAADFLAEHVRPAVSTADEATALRAADPLLAVDTGMQRFACPAEHVAAALIAGAIREAFTHATRVEHAEQLLDITRDRDLKLHAAASSLLHEPAARLHATRPGIACYRGALDVSIRLHDVRASRGPIGYTGFVTETGRHGVILAGYSNGLKPGICLLNGARRRILEVGMQSSYVELGPGDSVGDSVVLVGRGLRESEVAAAWQMGEHQAMLHLSCCGQRTYVE